jgi:outer membrane protein OmpA-like peptidoglycan-associated protein
MQPTMSVALILAVLAAGGEKVPLAPELTIVTAVAQAQGDYESVKIVRVVNDKEVRLNYVGDLPAPGRPGKSTRLAGMRFIERQALAASHEYMLTFLALGPNIYPGATALGTSAEVLAELKAKGKTEFAFWVGAPPNPLAKMTEAIRGAKAAAQRPLGPVKGVLEQVGVEPFPVLVNGARVELSAVHARGRFEDEPAEFFFLDDPANPLALAYDLGKHGVLHVTRITFPVKEAPTLEKRLEKEGRVELEGITFDFGSATLRAESAPVLDQVSAMLTRNKGWSLQVEGHTDDVGGPEYNLDLSRRRAEAVKAALEKRGVAAERLTPQGFGASQPKESNQSLAGRARNRRVELVKK